METFLYVIAGRETGPVKIGFSTNPDKRLRQLQTGHPERLTLHHVQAFPAKDIRLFERLVHKAIAYTRMKGEWFGLDVATAIAEVEFVMIRYGEDPSLRYHLGK